MKRKKIQSKVSTASLDRNLTLAIDRAAISFDLRARDCPAGVAERAVSEIVDAFRRVPKLSGRIVTAV